MIFNSDVRFGDLNELKFMVERKMGERVETISETDACANYYILAGGGGIQNFPKLAHLRI